MAVASRWPYRECLRVASCSRSTSFGVRYSRSRRSALRRRRGVTVRFTMVEARRAGLGFPMINVAFRGDTVRVIDTPDVASEQRRVALSHISAPRILAGTIFGDWGFCP